MNFYPVGRDSEGRRYMKFHMPFNVVEKIQLLQRWILVQSFAYYELNENIASDFKYDENALQLTSLMREHPEEATRSRYHGCFYDYCAGDEDAHYTSGFDLLDRVKKTDSRLYKYLHMDAVMALENKAKFGGAV